MYTKTFKIFKVRKQMGWYWWWIPFWLGTELLTFFSEIYGAQCWFSFLGWTPCCPGWACTSSWAKAPRIPRLVWWCLWIPPHPEVWWSLHKKLDTFKVGKGLRKSLVCKLGNLVDVVEFAWLQYLNPEAAPQTFYEQWVKQIKTV